MSQGLNSRCAVSEEDFQPPAAAFHMLTVFPTYLHASFYFALTSSLNLALRFFLRSLFLPIVRLALCAVSYSISSMLNSVSLIVPYQTLSLVPMFLCFSSLISSISTIRRVKIFGNASRISDGLKVFFCLPEVRTNIFYSALTVPR